MIPGYQYGDPGTSAVFLELYGNEIETVFLDSGKGFHKMGLINTTDVGSYNYIRVKLGIENDFSSSTKVKGNNESHN